MEPIDLRSDTVTLPTRGMLEGILDSRLGDDVMQEDRTVRELEELAARMFGTEDALLVTSGTQGNLVSILTHCGHGDEIIMDHQAHIYYYEVGGLAALAGVTPNMVVGDRGVFTGEDVLAANRGRDIHYPESSMVAIENTHNRGGGTVWTEEATRDVVETAHDLGMVAHIDGARIFNASVATGTSPDRLMGGADSLTFCLSKGLSCPIGSVVVGAGDFIEAARKKRKMVGGGMRQAGVIAAPGIVALRTMVDRLEDDHRNARILAEGLRGIGLQAEDPETNIVMFDPTPSGMDANEYETFAKGRGVELFAFDPTRVRMVTHHGIEESHVREVIERLS